MSQLTGSAGGFMQKFFEGEKLGIIGNIAQDEKIDGKYVTVNDKQLHFFGNCSYLGLEQHETVKQRSIDAINKYGAVFSSSRTYISINYLQQVEEKLQQLFGKPTLITQTTGLGHIAWIPLVATKGDVIIMDHQVHRTVQNAVNMVKAGGVAVELLRHNRMDLLEEKIIALSKTYNKVWYMADSIYSMYGDVAPMYELQQLLNNYEQFYLYIDDAHGMSWVGTHGRGFVLNEIDYHPKMCLATSLVKGFGANGAALIFVDEQMRDLVRLAGSPFIFSGAPSPAAIGAIDGSADVHLSKEINVKQTLLNSLMHHVIDTCKQLQLPLIRQDVSPVFYIGIGGQNSLAGHIVKDLINAGYLVNPCSYPSVPLKNEGIRFTITTHQTKESITGLLNALSSLLQQHGVTQQMIMPAFEEKNNREEVRA
jgi:7-keto-8-aminopelargonate synthetase-like enzyme